VLLLAALACLPFAAGLVPRRGAALALLVAVPAAAGVVALAARVPAGSLLALDRNAWAAVADLVPSGLRQGAETSLPLRPGEAPALAGLLDLALAGLVVAVAWLAAVRRRPLAAIGVAGAGMGYRWTVAQPENPILSGALALAAALLVVRLLRPGGPPGWRQGAAPGWVILSGVAVVVAAAALAAGPARAGDGWWNWRSWEVSSGAGTYVLDLEQRYGQLDWPEDPVPVARVRSPQALPLRAVVLERFDGIRFTSAPAPARRVLPQGGHVATGPPPAAGEEAVAQRVELLAGESPVVLAGGRAVSVAGPVRGTVEVIGDAVRVDPPLRRGDGYRVEVAVPDPDPEALLAVSGYAGTALPSDGLTQVAAGAGGATVDVPAWGTDAPAPAPEDFGPYAGVYLLSREWIGDAATPYQAVNRIETRLRAGYAYDERPPFPPAGVPPLVDFLTGSRRGFCQQFAGSMALMLRMNGIPARVAVGFAPGRYDPRSGVFEVVDRDAHSWVEVWFPGYGWLPFDPTPGRFAPGRASVSSPDYAPPARVAELGIERRSVRAPVVREPDRAGRGRGAAVRTGAEAQLPGGGRPAWVWALVPLGLAGAGAAAVPAAKALRRARRRRLGDARARLLGAIGELEAALLDLGLAPDPALTPAQRGEVLLRAGLDARDLYRLGADARYAVQPPSPEAAAWAWREAARLRRAARGRVPAARRVTAPFRLASIRRAKLAAR
jgi:transglutaminase-like putative cysteine protease